MSRNELKSLQVTDLLAAIIAVRDDYEAFCRRPLQMTNNDKFTQAEKPEWVERWNKWVQAHNTLLSTHDRICDSGDFPALYQPTAKRGFGQPMELI